MRVKVEENRMVVVTDISKSCIEKGYTDLTARDEKGNELYKICVNTEGNGSIGCCGCVINTFVDGMAAIAITLPMDVELDDVKRTFGKALANLQKYSLVIAGAAEDEEAAIEEIFAQ